MASNVAIINGIQGTYNIQDGFLFFHAAGGTFKWSFATWLKYEKSKKSAKVRIRFTEGPLKLAEDESNSSILEKDVIIVDFGNDRDTLEAFCSLISAQGAAAQVESTSQATAGPGSSKKDEDASAPVKAPVAKEPVNESIQNNRKKVLETNPDIAQLYQQLVLSADGVEEGVVSAEDFWNHHSIDLLATLSQSEAPSHLDGFIATPPINEFVNGQRLYRYTPELGKALLNEDATIRALHKQFVLGKQYPEESFWKRILQSRHFYYLIGEKIPENQILYDEIKGTPIKPVVTVPPSASNVLGKVDIHSDLIRLDDLKKRRKISQSVKQLLGRNFEPDYRATLFDRFNAHGAKIIDTCKDSGADTGSLANLQVIEDRAEGERKRKIADVVCHDLIGSRLLGDPGNDELCIIRSLNMPGDSIEGQDLGDQQNTTSNARSTSDIVADTQGWLAEMREFDILKHVRTSLCDDYTNRRMFILNTKLCQSEKITQTVPLEYDTLTISKMRQFQLSIMEILQIYYKTLLPEEHKRLKLLLAIRQIKQNIESQQDFVGSAHAAKALQTGLMNQITAVEVYDAKLKAYVAGLRNQAQQRMSQPR
ncbi:BSD domain family protein [Babesia bovis T2Bo]|uniref:BSD domain family protein n=1 Tax=Babesia bovis T2Bo TaxID=484906 RepID=UPI001C34BA0D|nr:BSD domain family protein [Babesia bovis T2Bo]EDO08353.2 BSD domain family protein [Babesia bovis T2Bo]